MKKVIKKEKTHMSWAEYRPKLANRLRIAFVKPYDAGQWKIVGVFRKG